MLAKLLIALSLTAGLNVITPKQAPEAIFPVQFTYDGVQFDSNSWKISKSRENDAIIVRYTSPDEKLLLEVTYRQYGDFPVTEVVPVLKNISSVTTGVIEDFNSLKFTCKALSDGVKVRRITGSLSAYTDFCRQDVLLQRRPGCDKVSMNSHEGRSSAWLPYFGLDLDPTHGYEFALGWTGTWHADIKFGRTVILETGIGEKTHFVMEPGEEFRMPYIVIYEREGKSAEDGLAEFHRFIIEHKSPRDAQGKLFEPLLPLTASGGNKTDETMLKVLEQGTETFKVPFNVFWVDAGWYGAPHDAPQDTNCGPFWYKWAGYWTPNTVAHPDGNLKRVSDAAHAKGMRFLLWFEPERATIHAPIVHEHPEFFHRNPAKPGNEEFLLDLGNPDAREWIIGEVCRNIEESGIDIYRQDFNFDPLPIWKGMDTQYRQGVAEIKHINGLYAFWDELHRRYPDMMFENCASGGRRMDIEMMSRSHSYCRDDAQMFSSPEELSQNITINATPYIPFTGGETFMVKPMDSYAFLSCMSAGTVFTPCDFSGMLLKREPSKEEVDWFTQMLTIADRVRPLFSGDFYSLTGDQMDGHDIYCGYQLNRADAGDGFFIIFRRAKCPDDSFFLKLRGIDPNANYVVEEFGSRAKTMKGKDLAKRILTFPEPRTFKLVFYKKK